MTTSSSTAGKPEIRFLDDAIADLGSIGPSNIPKVLAKLELLETNPEAGAPLGGDLTGFRKLVVGNNTWRVVYRVVDDVVEVCEVWAVGARSDSEVYAEATSRVANLDNPTFHSLAQVIDRLGRAAGATVARTGPSPPPLPDWLRDRLVHTAGVPLVQVVAMSGPEALEAWTRYCGGESP